MTFPKVKLTALDCLLVNAPWSGSLAFVRLTELKDIVAIICMLVGAGCTILVTRKRLKSRKVDQEDEAENEKPE